MNGCESLQVVFFFLWVLWWFQTSVLRDPCAGEKTTTGESKMDPAYHGLPISARAVCSPDITPKGSNHVIHVRCSALLNLGLELLHSGFHGAPRSHPSGAFGQVSASPTSRWESPRPPKTLRIRSTRALCLRSCWTGQPRAEKTAIGNHLRRNSAKSRPCGYTGRTPVLSFIHGHLGVGRDELTLFSDPVSVGLSQGCSG